MMQIVLHGFSFQDDFKIRSIHDVNNVQHGASKIFYTYLLLCFLLENTKKINFQTSNLPLAFQNK